MSLLRNIPRTLLGAVTAGLLLASTAAPASAATRGEFAPVPLPFFWPSNSLRDIAAGGPDSVWIVGDQGEIVIPGPIPGTGTTIPGNPVVRRWKNGGWVQYPLGGIPNHATISGVDARGPEDVWISGTRHGDTGGSFYVGRFDGAKFAEVALPAGVRHASLQADASGVWLITLTDVFRWTGGAWTAVTALPQSEFVLNAQLVRADDDIWRIGHPSRYDTSLVAQHWDGHAWTVTPLGLEGVTGGTTVRDIVALSADDIWIVGDNTRRTFALAHWDGTAWTKAATPAGISGLQDADRAADGTIWAIGHSSDDLARPGLVRFSGGTWQRVPTTAVPNRTNFYGTSLAVVPGTGDLWTLGSVNIGGPMVLSDK